MGQPSGPTLTEPALRTALATAGVPIATFDVEGHVVSANAPFAALFDQPLDAMVGTHLMGLCDTRAAAHALAALVRVIGRVSDSEVVEIDVGTEPGRNPKQINLTFAAFAFPDGRLDKVMCVGSSAQVPRSAVAMDSEVVERILTAAINRSSRSGYPFSLLTCDFDGMSSLEDEFGTELAAMAKEACAARLEQRLRPSDQVCRTEDDSVIVVAEALGDEQDAAGVAYRLLATMVEPIVVDGTTIGLPLTIGVAVADGLATVESVLSASADALRAAKAADVGGFTIVDIRPGLAA